MAQSGFFDKFPGFYQVHTAGILHEFSRLAQNQGWPRGSMNWKIYRRECLQAEYEFHFGSIEANDKLAGWQRLCRELGIQGSLRSITRCKEELKRVYVNLLDFIDDRRAQQVTTRYPSEAALAEYTKQSKRFFPRDDSEGEKLIKILLRQIIQPGRHRQRA